MTSIKDKFYSISFSNTIPHVKSTVCGKGIVHATLLYP